MTVIFRPSRGRQYLGMAALAVTGIGIGLGLEGRGDRMIVLAIGVSFALMLVVAVVWGLRHPHFVTLEGANLVIEAQGGVRRVPIELVTDAWVTEFDAGPLFAMFGQGMVTLVVQCGDVEVRMKPVSNRDASVLQNAAVFIKQSASRA